MIAIIALLAAILFPVFGRVREQTRQATTQAQMHDIYQALKLYHEDNNRYPASLYGFVQGYNAFGTPGEFYTGSGNIVPMDKLTYRPLFKGQKYLTDKSQFVTPDHQDKDPGAAQPPVAPGVVTPAYYPNIPGSPLSGQGVVFSNLIKLNMGRQSDSNFPVGGPAYFYKYDAMDIGPKLAYDANGNIQTFNPPQYELHYSLDWNGYNYGATPTGPSGKLDPTTMPQNDGARNQLKFNNLAPEDSTIVTWSSDHAVVAGSDKVLVLFLNGKTRAIDAKTFLNKGPLGF